MLITKISCTVLHFLADLPYRIRTTIYPDLLLVNFQILAWCPFSQLCFNGQICRSSSVHCVFLFQDFSQFLFVDGGKSLFIFMDSFVCHQRFLCLHQMGRRSVAVRIFLIGPSISILFSYRTIQIENRKIPTFNVRLI